MKKLKRDDSKTARLIENKLERIVQAEDPFALGLSELAHGYQKNERKTRIGKYRVLFFFDFPNETLIVTEVDNRDSIYKKNKQRR